MKLQRDGNQFTVSTRLGDLSLVQVLKFALAKDGRTLCQLESACGFMHPRLCNIEYDNQPNLTLPTAVAALMELGHEITIAKAAEAHGAV